MGKSRLVRQGREREEGQPLAARSRLEAAHRSACAKGDAGDGAPAQRPRRRGLETVCEGMTRQGLEPNLESERQSSLFSRKYM